MGTSIIKYKKKVEENFILKMNHKESESNYIFIPPPPWKKKKNKNNSVFPIKGDSKTTIRIREKGHYRSYNNKIRTQTK